ncbi:MAG TPA: helix-turn-helix domain-containing protein [Roseiflexaceae bacterium]|nr:helix-turn-helix domain-containing protein [Roseiflexaceae bacterium]
MTRTRALLLDAFLDLLGEKDFEALTVQDIATRATVNRATFYAHFPDKYAALETCIRTGFQHSVRQRLGADEPDRAQLRQLFLAVTDHLAAFGRRCRRPFKMFEALVEAEIKTQLRGDVRRWLAAQPAAQGQPEQRLDTVATMLSWSIYGAALEWHRRAERLAAERFADEVVPLLEASVAALAR